MKTACNIVKVLYYLYFENRELVYHFERIWTKDGWSCEDEEYSYIFLGAKNPSFPVDLETYYFLYQNNIIEETSGNEYECIYTLTNYFRTILSSSIKEKYKEPKTVAE